MVSRAEKKELLNREPKFDDINSSLKVGQKLPKGIMKEIKEAIALARKFNDEVVKPNSLTLDLKMHEDPDYLPWEIVKKANEYGFYSLFLPRMLGGGGYSLLAAGFVAEELASECLGIANLVLVHYLGVASLAESMNSTIMAKIFREIADGEKTGEPCTLSTAITEPGAGTDVEEVELVDRGNIACHAKKVEGGYVVNGTKVFISCGHLAIWHVLIAYTDLKKPSENMIEMVVRTGTKGFSLGRMERKLGQKGCCASELIFDDCFIPDEQVCVSSADYDSYKLDLSKKEILEVFLDDVLAGSRAGVGAMGAGVARSAYEQALKFATETEVNGKLLINHEWAQCILTDMYSRVATARLTWMESSFMNSLYGPTKALLSKPVYYYLKYTPKLYFKFFVAPLFKLKIVTKLMRKARIKDNDQSENQLNAGWGSIAKYMCTDAGIKNCHKAVELMGLAGIRHDRNVEKLLRDAKLLQIYEGTNQLNRLNVFKCMIAPPYSQVKLYNEEL